MRKGRRLQLKSEGAWIDVGERIRVTGEGFEMRKY
jgi:hypothetical protein